jgi:serine/threonine-protein kinase HipA
MTSSSTQIRSVRLKKVIEPHLYVGIQINGEFLYAGNLEFNQIGKDFQATFTYSPQYLELARVGQAFAIDPINLPLGSKPYVTFGRYDKLGSLFDAAPDAWGRTVMALDERTSVDSITEAQVLIKGRGMGVGAIFFSQTEIGPAFKFPTPARISLDQISKLYKNIQRIEQGLRVEDNTRLALIDSWDIGGARPKAIVYDALGCAWIAKFPRKQDTYSRQRVEWANLAMAREIGMTVPESQLVDLPDGESVILVKRFDRGNRDHPVTGEQRHHFLSAAALVSPPHDFDKYQMDTPYGASYFSYARIADVVRKVSSNAARDLSELYARMVLNVLVSNTDDHLKNTGFLLDENSSSLGLRLAPLFDVVTQEGHQSHMLHIGPGTDPSTRYKHGRKGTIENLISGAKSAGIKPQSAQKIIDHIQNVLALRHEFYQRAGMSAEEGRLVESMLSPEIVERATTHRKIKPQS